MSGIRTDQLALYVKDMYKAEREGYLEAPTVYDKVYKVKSDAFGAGDKNTQILGAGDLVRHTAEGQDVQFKSPVQGWEFLVKYWTWSDGLTLTKEAVEDTVKLGNLLKDLAATWGESVRVEKETWAARPFNEGGNLSGDVVFNGSHTGNTDSSGDLMHDSEPLFNLTGNTRSTKGGGTYYNADSSLVISPEDFDTLYSLMTATNNRNERDRIIKNPMDTALTRPGSDAFKMERILDTSRGLPSGELNDMNPYYKLVDSIAWDYLEEAEAEFYIGKRQHKDFQFHQRQMPEIRFFRDEENLGYKASINMRCGIFIKNWRCWGRAGGTYA